MDLVQEAIAVATKMSQASTAADTAQQAAVAAEVVAESAKAEAKSEATEVKAETEAQAKVEGQVVAATEAVTEIQAPEATAAVDEAKALNAKYAKNFAELVRREKRWTTEQQAKAEVAAAKQAAEQATAEAAKAKELVESFRTGDPIAAMEALGVDFTQLSKRLLGEKPTADDEVTALRKEVAAFKVEQANKLKAIEDAKVAEQQTREQAQAQNLYNQRAQDFKTEIKKTIEAEPDKFELCLIHGSVDDIFDTVAEHYKESGEILETAVAAELVEQYHMAQAEKISKARKLAKVVKTEPVKESGPSKKPKVVSNSGAMSAPDRDSRPLTESERIQAAIRLIAKT
jgi:hypothetical protein